MKQAFIATEEPRTHNLYFDEAMIGVFDTQDLAVVGISMYLDECRRNDQPVPLLDDLWIHSYDLVEEGDDLEERSQPRRTSYRLCAAERLFASTLERCIKDNDSLATIERAALDSRAMFDARRAANQLRDATILMGWGVVTPYVIAAALLREALGDKKAVLWNCDPDFTTTVFGNKPSDPDHRMRLWLMSTHGAHTTDIIEAVHRPDGISREAQINAVMDRREWAPMILIAAEIVRLSEEAEPDNFLMSEAITEVQGRDLQTVIRTLGTTAFIGGQLKATGKALEALLAISG